jgi:hypothetical protein
MRTFHAIDDYHVFAEKITERSRYRFDSFTETFLKTVEDTGIGRIETMPTGTILFRAQLGHRENPNPRYRDKYRYEVHPYEKRRMTPQHKSAKEGRVNPKGIPCLYLASQSNTATSEMRPWLDAYVSLGHFRTVRELKLMDCTAAGSSGNISLSDIGRTDSEVLEGPVWGHIANAFSEPVTASDKTADYAPTQVLAEVFKNMGCDGIKYRSRLGKEGFSFALFKLEDAQLFHCGIHQTSGIQHRFTGEIEAYKVLPDGSEEVEEQSWGDHINSFINEDRT